VQGRHLARGLLSWIIVHPYRALWRGRALGFVLAPVLLGFGALMTATIAFLTVLMEVRGVAEGGYPVAVTMLAVAALSLALLVWMLSTLSRKR